MIYEMRIYELLPGRVTDYLNLFRTEGIQFVTQHLPMGGYWSCESGIQNRIHHLWIYENFEERAACRVKLSQDNAWTQGFVSKAFPLIARQENRFLLLEQGSDSLTSVTNNRRTNHRDQALSEPLYAPNWMSLCVHTEHVPGGHTQVATWRVVAGDRPGLRYTLLSHQQPDDALVGVCDNQVVEILRPCAFSPLQ
ncbi:NIPSNAP family protein [Sedimenticola sp.]|uniref:NIPSNAP family protein n=1 Tax=Sedimenticola sp. TaxID=1940285 RepID=UPI003D0B8E12